MEEGREKGHGVARWFRSRGTITWMNLAAGITLGFLIGLYVGDTSQWWLLIVAALFALSCLTNLRVLLDNSRWDADGVLITDRSGTSSKS